MHKVSFNIKDEVISSNDPAESLQEILQKLSLQSPRNDPHLSRLYRALYRLIANNTRFRAYILQLFFERKHQYHNSTLLHFAVLLQKAIQYVLLYEHGVYEDIHYIDKIKTVTDWKKIINVILYTQQDLLKKLMTTSSIVTNMAERYIGPLAIMHGLYDGKSLSIIDLGCSTNRGVRMIMEASRGNYLFHQIVDNTPNKVILQCLLKPISIEKAIGVDRIDFDKDENMLAWFLACDHYPTELKTIPETRALLKRLQQVPNTPIVQADLLNVTDYFKPQTFDVVIFSSVLYQIPLQRRRKTIENAYILLKPDGVIIIQDTAYLTERRELIFSPEFGRPYGYRLFIYSNKTANRIREILRFKDNRCSEIQAGKDFKYVF